MKVNNRLDIIHPFCNRKTKKYKRLVGILDERVLTEDELYYYRSILEWASVLCNYTISECLLLQCNKEVSVFSYHILTKQNFGLDFIYKNREFLNIRIELIIEQHKQLTFEFIEQHLYEFNLYEVGYKYITDRYIINHKGIKPKEKPPLSNPELIQLVINKYHFKYEVDRLQCLLK